MRFFDNKLNLILLIFALPLLFLPKINLIQIDANETAGLRIDDLVLLFLGTLIFLSHAFSGKNFLKIEGWIVLITGFSIFSFAINQFLVWNQFLGTEAKFLYSIRWLEYFLFFYLGAIAIQYFRLSFLVKAFFGWNLLVMILQKFNLIGALAVSGYLDNVTSRVHGIASFASEMGLLLNLIFCYLIFDSNKFKKIYLIGMFCLFQIFVIFTGNRISILALFVCFLARYKDELNWRSKGSFIFLTFTIAFGGFLVFYNEGVYERSLDLISFKNLELFPIIWENIDIQRNLMGDEVIASAHYDLSWWIRLHKWLFTIKTYLSHPECYLQGLGPGFCGAALDGGLLRILTELGLIGTFLFWKFFGCLYSYNRQSKWMVIAFLINMIFFDAHLAYKTMSFILFVCGAIFALKQQEENRSQVDLTFVPPIA